MTTWISEQVIQLAPDDASAKAAKPLASAAKWQLRETDGNTLWGLCKGSGSKPYQTRVDLAEPAFKCSCPSRKFPCKHSLALMLLHASDGAGFTQGTPPPWVQEWLDGRAQRQERKVARAEKAPDPEAQAKRAAQRASKVDQGVAELQTWLGDRLREGLAELPGKNSAFWDTTAARTVDAQAPGLGGRLRRLWGQVGRGEDWPGRCLSALGELHLLARGWTNLAAQPEALQAEIRAHLGESLKREAVLAGEPVVDCWAVLAVSLRENDGVLIQRVWLRGMGTGRPALLLNFAHQTQRASLPVGYVPPRMLAGSLYFYPGPTPLRALAGELEFAANLSELPGESILAATTHYREQLRENPFLGIRPLVLNDVRVSYRGKRFWLSDAGHELPVEADFQDWRLLAVSGGEPVNVFGLWNGETLFPRGVFNAGRYTALVEGGDAELG